MILAPLLNFFKFDICVTCRLAFLKNLLKKKTVLFVLFLLFLVFILTGKNKPATETDKFKFTNKHKLCVLVPFRNRFNQLIELVPHLTKFLRKQNVQHQILVMNQVDNYRFNRASLINVGFLVSEKMNCDYIAIHDVDLLPVSEDIKYNYPKSGLMHLTAPGLHPKYNYSTFLGGILLITRHDFKMVNGMSNKYFGWGLEDDEFYQRIKRSGIQINQPELKLGNKKPAFTHLHSWSDKRDTAKLYNQKEVTRKVDHDTGLHNVQYSIEKPKKLEIDDFDALLYNVRLECDQKLTPWCKPKKPNA